MTQLAATNRILREIRDNMEGAAKAQRKMEEAQEGLNKKTNRFTRLADALANPKGKLAVFIKFGYAAIPMFFKMKNQVELTSRAIGALIEKVKGGEGGLLVGAAKGMANQFKKAKEIATDISEMKVKGGMLDAINYLSFGASGAIGKGAKGIMSGAKFLLKGQNRVQKIQDGLFNFAKKGEERGKNIFSKIKNLPFKVIFTTLGTFALFGLKIFIGLSLAIGVFLLLMKSKAFQNALKAYMEVLRSLKKPLMAAFTIIKEGFMLIYNGLFGGGGFWASLGMVLKGIGKILWGLIKILLTVAWGLLKGALIAVGVAIRDAAMYAVEEVIKYLRKKGGQLKETLNPFRGTQAFADNLNSVQGTQMMARGGIARGGVTLVGEEGPEFVKLPMGSRVFSNRDSRKMISNGGVNNITVNVQGRIGASDTELRQIASKIGSMINKEVNRTTSSRGTLG
jgi:hypothetical protein